jgi:hypothetical protein
VSQTLRGFVAKALGDVGGVVAIARLQKTVSNDRHADVRKAALSALRTAANADSVPVIAAALASDADAAVRRRAAEALKRVDHVDAIPRLCKAMLEDPDASVRAAAAEALAETGTWELRAATVVETLAAGALRRAAVDAERVVQAIAAPSDTDSFVLADYLIANAIGTDDRMTGILAHLIIAACKGDLAAAGERLNGYQRANSTPDEVLRALRIEIGGRTALDPVTKILQADLHEYFRLPIAQLNASTQQHWERTVRYAQFGVLTRVAMSILVFLLGRILLSVASWKVMFGAPDIRCRTSS